MFVIVDNKEECGHRHETMDEAMQCLSSYMEEYRNKNKVCYKTIVEVETEEELEELMDGMVLY